MLDQREPQAELARELGIRLLERFMRRNQTRRREGQDFLWQVEEAADERRERRLHLARAVASTRQDVAASGQQECSAFIEPEDGWAAARSCEMAQPGSGRRALRG